VRLWVAKTGLRVEHNIDASEDIFDFGPLILEGRVQEELILEINSGNLKCSQSQRA
jgi:hypothetical protein